MQRKLANPPPKVVTKKFGRIQEGAKNTSKSRLEPERKPPEASMRWTVNCREPSTRLKHVGCGRLDDVSARTSTSCVDSAMGDPRSPTRQKTIVAYCNGTDRRGGRAYPCGCHSCVQKTLDIATCWIKGVSIRTRHGRIHLWHSWT